MSDFLATQPVQSPCVSICVLDDDDVCMGCYRTGMEIGQWGTLSSEQQRLVVKRSQHRMRGDVVPCVVTVGE